eukprot:gene38557-52084_t
MGVTTIITGNCGGSKLNVGEFFSEIVKTKVALNVATLIGHNTVRGQVMGGSFARPPTAEELAKKAEEEAADLRDTDKPKNQIVRLEKYVVKEERPPIFTE